MSHYCSNSNYCLLVKTRTGSEKWKRCLAGHNIIKNGHGSD